MNKIYIITKEGRSYSTEGLKYVYKTVSEHFDFNKSEETEYLQGYAQNDFGYFTELVRNDLENGHEVYAAFSNQDPRLSNDFYKLDMHSLTVLADLARLASDTDEPISDTWELLEAIAYSRITDAEDASEGV